MLEILKVQEHFWRAVEINSPVKDIQVAGTSVVNDNVANITSISTDLLVQGTKTLILDGGGAE